MSFLLSLVLFDVGPMLTRIGTTSSQQNELLSQFPRSKSEAPEMTKASLPPVFSFPPRSPSPPSCRTFDSGIYIVNKTSFFARNEAILVNIDPMMLFKILQYWKCHFKYFSRPYGSRDRPLKICRNWVIMAQKWHSWTKSDCNISPWLLKPRTGKNAIRGWNESNGA